jgi:hypothetical protein
VIPKTHMARGDDEESLRFLCSMDRDHDKILTLLVHKIFYWVSGSSAQGYGPGLTVLH